MADTTNDAVMNAIDNWLKTDVIDKTAAGAGDPKAKKQKKGSGTGIAAENIDNGTEAGSNVETVSNPADATEPAGDLPPKTVVAGEVAEQPPCDVMETDQNSAL